MSNHPSTFRRTTVLAFFFISGACVPVLNSIILRAQYPWKNGLTLQFKKPWFQNWSMFIGMSLFSVRIFIDYIKKKKEGVKPDKTIFFLHFRSVAIPSILYIFSSLLQNYALMYMPTTVWQVFHGFQVLFTTLFAVTYRHQQLFLVDWLGLFISVLGICFTGVAALLRGTSNSDASISTIFFSFIIVIISHAIKAFQTIIEEQLLHDARMSGASLTASEGIWGVYICTFICMPVCNILNPMDPLFLYENSVETFTMLSMSPSLCILLFGYVCAVSIFAFTGIRVTEFSTAIHRNMYETLRPLPVWILSLIVFYATRNEAVGENLDVYTYLEMCGFLISIFGSLIYNRVIKLPCFTYIGEEKTTDTSASALFTPILGDNPRYT